MKLTTAAVFLLSTGTALADCGPDGTLYLGGSSTVSPLAEVWGETYSEECPNIDVVVQTGGSSEGARLACGIGSDLTADADIGMMSRGFKDEEAMTADDGFTYTCVFGDMGSTGVGIDVANDGVTVFAESGGTAGNCLEAIGSDGLSFDDLYFIFGDEQHLWSELNPACDAVDIEIAIPDTTGGTYDFFKSVVFANGVYPSIDSISAGLYDILGRQIFMRVRSSKAESAVPYVMDGLLGPTVDGFVPLSDNQTQAMLDRLATL